MMHQRQQPDGHHRGLAESCRNIAASAKIFFQKLREELFLPRKRGMPSYRGESLAKLFVGTLCHGMDQPTVRSSVAILTDQPVSNKRDRLTSSELPAFCSV